LGVKGGKKTSKGSIKGGQVEELVKQKKTKRMKEGKNKRGKRGGQRVKGQRQVDFCANTRGRKGRLRIFNGEHKETEICRLEVKGHREKRSGTCFSKGERHTATPEIGESRNILLMET